VYAERKKKKEKRLAVLCNRILFRAFDWDWRYDFWLPYKMLGFYLWHMSDIIEIITGISLPKNKKKMCAKSSSGSTLLHLRVVYNNGHSSSQ